VNTKTDEAIAMSTRTEKATRSRPDVGALTGLLCAVVFIGGLVATGALIPASAPPNLPDASPAAIQRYFLEYAGVA
jgi:hypothetical protein